MDSEGCSVQADVFAILVFNFAAYILFILLQSSHIQFLVKQDYPNEPADLKIGLEPLKGIRVQFGVVAWIQMHYVLPQALLIFLLKKLWDALTGDELHSFEHKHIVRDCAFSVDTHMPLNGGVEKVLRIFDLNRPDAPPREVDNSLGSIRIVAWLHSDQTILSSCTDIGGVR
ncbi:hypothetical protein Syun_029980 [Stephania yunnanensis]|uniref:Uncharacterized protein n=1 Tax=Stephania yunnanensis TaxID=152371 RepID=A0AAP0HKC8_9MAGN